MKYDLKLIPAVLSYLFFMWLLKNLTLYMYLTYYVFLSHGFPLYHIHLGFILEATFREAINL